MVEIAPAPANFDVKPLDADVLPAVEAPVEEIEAPEPEITPTPADLRERLRTAHRECEVARAERDRLAEALERARIELQRVTDAQHERETARQAEVARFVEARTAALLDGTEVEAALPVSAEDAALSGEVAAARLVAERLAAKLREAELAVRRAEAQVRFAAVALLIECGERRAIDLEIVETSARSQRAALVALAGLWTPDGPAGRARPIPIGPRCHWVLTDGDGSVPEAITGMRARRAGERGHIMPQETAVPNWEAALARLMADPEAEVP